MLDKINGFETIENGKPFKFWCQKILPLVYDDSLSYYELLCKVVHTLNELIGANNTTNSNVMILKSQVDKLTDYVNNYFENLDVQNEINNKLDEMFDSGELPELIVALLTNNRVFESFEDMSNANLKVGDYCRTLSYYKIKPTI